MAVASLDGGEWRLVEGLRGHAVLLCEGYGDERVHVVARVLVPGEGEDDTLVLHHFLDDAAHLRDLPVELFGRHHRTPGTAGRELPVELDAGEYLRPPPADHVVAVF